MIQFNEAHPDFSAYCVIGGWDYEGENAMSTRLFDSKQLASEYAETLISENFDYAKMFIISNDGTVWQMPGSVITFSRKNKKDSEIEQEVSAPYSFC